MSQSFFQTAHTRTAAKQIIISVSTDKTAPAPARAPVINFHSYFGVQCRTKHCFFAVAKQFNTLTLYSLMGGFISIPTASKMRKCLLSLFCLTHQRRTNVRILRLLLAICVSDTVVVAWLYSHSTSFHMFFLAKEATVTHRVAMKSRCLFHSTPCAAVILCWVHDPTVNSNQCAFNY